MESRNSPEVKMMIIAAAAHLGSIAICPAPPARRVTCVVDMDTVWIEREKIRLLEINAPEMDGRSPRESQIARRTRDRQVELLGERRVTIRRESVDRYGRALARLGDVGEVLKGWC